MTARNVRCRIVGSQSGQEKASSASASARSPAIALGRGFFIVTGRDVEMRAMKARNSPPPAQSLLKYRNYPIGVTKKRELIEFGFESLDWEFIAQAVKEMLKNCLIIRHDPTFDNSAR